VDLALLFRPLDWYVPGMTSCGRTSSRRARWAPASVLAVVALAGCGASRATGSSVGIAPPASPVPDGSATTAAPAGPANPTGAPSTELPLFFIRDGKLGVARRAMPADANIVTNALGSLLAGPTASEEQAGLSTAIPSLTRVRSTALMGDVVVINLSGSFSALGPETSPELRLAQIVYTVSIFPVRVLFQIDGQPARAVGGFVLPDRPLTRDDFAAWAPPVLVESVGPGELLTAATEISGSTAASEAGVGVRVTDAGGQVLFEGATTSAKGRGARHEFTTSAPFAATAPGPGTLTVWELSPAPGVAPLVLTIPVQLS
jgi:germination protein M